MEEKPAAAETKPEATEKQKSTDLRTFMIALLTSIIVVALYHFGMGAYKIFFPECEAGLLCEEEVTGEVVEGAPADEVRPPKAHFKGKKPGKPPRFDKDGKPRKFGKDGKPPRKFPKGKKPDQGKADAPADGKAPAKADAPADGKAPAGPEK